MKKLAFLLATVLISFTATAQENKGVTITVTIENVLADGGTILTSLHTENTFMKANGIQHSAAPAKIGEVSMTIENVQPGTFAIMVIHDANDNKQMDMEASGMPKESYGTSGEINLYGPPTFANAKFEVTDTDQEIRIRF